MTERENTRQRTIVLLWCAFWLCMVFLTNEEYWLYIDYDIIYHASFRPKEIALLIGWLLTFGEVKNFIQLSSKNRVRFLPMVTLQAIWLLVSFFRIPSAFIIISPTILSITLSYIISYEEDKHFSMLHSIPLYFLITACIMLLPKIAEERAAVFFSRLLVWIATMIPIFFIGRHSEEEASLLKAQGERLEDRNKRSIVKLIRIMGGVDLLILIFGSYLRLFFCLDIVVESYAYGVINTVIIIVLPLLVLTFFGFVLLLTQKCKTEGQCQKSIFSLVSLRNTRMLFSLISLPISEIFADRMFGTCSLQYDLFFPFAFVNFCGALALYVSCKRSACKKSEVWFLSASLFIVVISCLLNLLIAPRIIYANILMEFSAWLVAYMALRNRETILGKYTMN